MKVYINLKRLFLLIILYVFLHVHEKLTKSEFQKEKAKGRKNPVEETRTQVALVEPSH